MILNQLWLLSGSKWKSEESLQMISLEKRGRE